MPVVDDESTLQAGERHESREAARLPMVTIIAHPDATRVGDIATITGVITVSRAEPVFASPSGRTSSPLNDRHVSRKPAVELTAVGDRVRVTPHARVILGGHPLSAPVELDAGALERGVTLELANRVALLAHRRARPRPGLERFGFVGHSEAIERLAGDIERVADLDVSVLVTGPTGVGKELVARAIHELGPRRTGPLVAVSMAALSATTAASQLFGHVKGAFTGADRNHAGFFAAADGGTLFLDEIGETPPEIQAMLLRALEERAVLAVGATTPQPVDVRLVAATDADLDADVASGRFKAPLLHRLAGFRIRIPSLAQRADDVGRLLVHFLRDELAAAREPDRLASTGDTSWLPPSLVAQLVRHAWPGNVRELRNVARHIVIANRGRDVVEIDDYLCSLGTLDAAPVPAATSWTARRPADIEPDELVEALRAHGWRTSATAAALGISRTSLYMLMDKSDRIRKARDLSADEIRRTHAAGATVDQLAAKLEVSERGLKLRLRELGIEL